MSSASWALQQAMFAAVGADAALCALIGDPPRLYDAPPRQAIFPYLVFAEDGETAWNTGLDSASEHLIVFHVWSRAGGRKENKAIADALRACLDDAALVPTGHRLVSLSFRKAQHGREKDGVTFRTRIEFRAVTEPTA